LTYVTLINSNSMIDSKLTFYTFLSSISRNHIWLLSALLNSVGCFTYSEVDGAVFNALPNHVPEDEKQHCFERL